MHFSPAFSLLPKFSIYVERQNKSREDIEAVAKYLGVILPSEAPDRHVSLLAKELERQNGFLSRNLEFDEIYLSLAYEKSAFVREIVANNRRRKHERQIREGKSTPSEG